MELDELKSMWQAREASMEKSAKLNTQLLDKIESRKIQSILKPLLVQNQIVLVSHILFIAGLLIFFVYHISRTALCRICTCIVAVLCLLNGELPAANKGYP